MHGGKLIGGQPKGYVPLNAVRGALLAWAERKALGLPYLSGRPPLRWRHLDNRARAIAMVDEAIKALPAVAEGPVESWTLPEIVTENGRQGLLRLREFMSVELLRDAESGEYLAPKAARMALDAAAISVRTLVRHAEGELRARETSALVQFLERLNREREALGAPTVTVEGALLGGAPRGDGVKVIEGVAATAAGEGTRRAKKKPAGEEPAG